MTIIDIIDDLTHYDHSSGTATPWIEKTFMADFDSMETELEELLEELDEVCGMVCNLSMVLENMGYIDSYVYDMGSFDDIMDGLSPSELLKKIDLERFNPRDDYFSWDVWGVYSGNDISDFDDLSALDSILTELQEDATTLLDYIRGNYYDGISDLEKHKRDIINDFIAYLEENADHLEDVEELRRSAII